MVKEKFVRWFSVILFGLTVFILGFQIGKAKYIPHYHGYQPQIYISDFWNHRLVRINNMEGKGFVSLGDAGRGIGQFNGPRAIAIDSKGRIYLVDSDNDRIVRMNNMRGDGWKAYGHPGGGIGEFNDPRGIALDAKGRIYIADFGNNR
ncbi:MAG: NHL repeat-containing protein, partial [Firmicutes bacterium]|nr:NHL repeat-containing protein [Bacillota bacterium]